MKSLRSPWIFCRIVIVLLKVLLMHQASGGVQESVVKESTVNVDGENVDDLMAQLSALQ